MGTRFVLECFWPGVTAAAHAAATTRAEAAADELRAGGRDVRFLGASLVPADEIAYYRVAAASVDDAREVGDRAGLPYDRIVEYVDAPPTN